VDSSCELGNEPSGSIKCWEIPSGCTSCGLSSDTQLHRVLVSYEGVWESRCMHSFFSLTSTPVGREWLTSVLCCVISPRDGQDNMDVRTFQNLTGFQV
jgi:hypothetical protein